MRAGLHLPTAGEVLTVMERSVRGEPSAVSTGWETLVLELVASNLRQWDLEDATRDPRADDAEVGRAKRAIDRLNLARHQLVEQIDAQIDASIEQPPTATIATETPGMVLDRLSVLVIRRFRTVMVSADDAGYRARIPLLDAQIAGLSAALDAYLAELRAGTRRFVPYEHLKLYGSASPPPPR